MPLAELRFFWAEMCKRTFKELWVVQVQTAAWKSIQTITQSICRSEVYSPINDLYAESEPLFCAFSCVCVTPGCLLNASAGDALPFCTSQHFFFCALKYIFKKKQTEYLSSAERCVPLHRPCGDVAARVWMWEVDWGYWSLTICVFEVNLATVFVFSVSLFA